MQDLHLNEDHSDEYRSVIDDLTIENKRLRQKLKKYERIHASHLNKDRLFEVTFHGLPPEKRRDLEATLRAFAAGLGPSSPGTSDSAASPRRHLPTGDRKSNDASSSSLSQLRHADSGFASMSVSGQTSNIQSLHAGRRTDQQMGAQDRRVRSYLHDMPARLLPKHAPVMTEHSRKKLVVRRLEQLFTGRALEEHKYSLAAQQHAVSQSAAKADRSEMEANGQDILAEEGHREARILPVGAECPRDEFEPGQGVDATPTISGDANSEDRPACPEQRPTRPLDLDLHRAQHPAEIIDYIRHLGISTPSVDHTNNANQTDGWVYLNLLANMAQLHTINVTPEFTRQAVSELSDKLEISQDGRKIRWRGGTKGTKLSSESSSGVDQDSLSSPDEEDEQLGGKRKRARTSSMGLTRRSMGDDSRSKANVGDAPRALSGVSMPRPLSRPIGAPTHQKSSRSAVNRLQYKPLFHHLPSDDDDYSDDVDSLSSSSSEGSWLPPAGRESLLKSNPPAHASSSRRKDARNGPLIFYSKAKFCTDLSGEKVRPPQDGQATVGYGCLTSEVIGAGSRGGEDGLCKSPSTPGRPSRENELARLATGRGADDASSTEMSDWSTTFSLSGSSASDPTRERDMPTPTPFEVSGLGGVQPSDHFVISSRRRLIVNRQPSPEAANTRMGQCWQEQGRDLPRRRDATLKRPIVSEELLCSTRTDLPPSELPQPSHIHLSSSSEYAYSRPSLSRSSSGDSYGSVSQRSVPSPPRLTRMFSTLSTPGPSDPATSSSSSIDLLATARKHHPLLISQQERDYDLDLQGDSLSTEAIEADCSDVAVQDGSSMSSSDASPFLQAVDVREEQYSLKRNRASADDVGAGHGRAKVPRL